jgi:hypothetical protein
VTTLAATGCTAAAGILVLDEALRLWSPVFAPIGEALGLAAPERAYHGLAAVLMTATTIAMVYRLLRKGERFPVARSWDLFLCFALVALAQGALAYRGVSAIYILAVAGLIAFQLGWRVAFARGNGRFVVSASRQQQPQRGQRSEQSERWVGQP